MTTLTGPVDALGVEGTGQEARLTGCMGTGREARPTALDAAMAAIDRAAAAAPCSPVVRARARGLLAGYHARWAGAGLEAFALRTPLRAPIVNPASGRSSRTFRLAGECDGVVGWRDRRFVLEVRTAAEEIDRPDAPFWQRAALDDRPGLYALALARAGRRVEGTLFDVVRRPALAPRLLPKGKDPADQGTLAEVLGRGTYFGRALARAEREAVRQGAVRESPDMLALRVAADAEARPAWYFRRRVLLHRPEWLEAVAAGLWQAAAEVRAARRQGFHPMNAAACALHGPPCPYLPLCAGGPAPRPENGDRRKACEGARGPLRGEWSPSVLAGPAHDPRRLTPSRLDCFRLCRRKHYYRYEAEARPLLPEQGEAMLLGRLVREGVTAWWQCFLVDR